MSTPALKMAFLSDTHLGYAAKCASDPQTGLNWRVRDGYFAFKQTVTQAIEADVDLVVHGGDLFHRSWPSVGDIVWARKQLERFAAAGIPVYGNTGNHDASAERGKSPATAAVHDPNRGIHMITDPYQQIELADGLFLHAVSHYGLAQETRLLPDPVNGAVNILTAHGAALVPGHEIFHCADSPGEQPIGLDLLTNDGFAMHLLGHYHGMGEIIDNVWYAGSAIRRGFSDPEGGRGWLLVTIHTDGSVKVEPQYINQRAQHDLPRINAKGLTGSDVEERIRANLAGVDLDKSIVRQVVTNCSTPIRSGIDQPGLKAFAENGNVLMWMPDLRRPDATDDDGERTVEGVGASLKTAGSADLPTMYSGWISGYLSDADVAVELVPIVKAEGGRHLKAASLGTEAGDMEVAAKTEAAPASDPTADPTADETLAVPVEQQIFPREDELVDPDDRAYGLGSEPDNEEPSLLPTGTNDEPPF